MYALGFECVRGVFVCVPHYFNSICSLQFERREFKIENDKNSTQIELETIVHLYIKVTLKITLIEYKSSSVLFSNHGVSY